MLKPAILELIRQILTVAGTALVATGLCPSLGFGSCGAGVRYLKTDLKGVQIDAAGCLTDDCLRRLQQHIPESEIVPQTDIEVAGAALAAALA